MSSFLFNTMILKCAAKKFARAAHACSKERRSGSHEATLKRHCKEHYGILAHWWSPAPVFNAVGSSGGIPYFTETLPLKNFDHENANKLKKHRLSVNQ